MRECAGSPHRSGGILDSNEDGTLALFRAVFDSVPDALVVADDAGTIMLANDAAGTLFSTDGPALRGQSAASLVEPLSDWPAVAHGNGLRTRYVDDRGRTLDVEATPGIQPDRHLVVLRDRTDETRLLDELGEARRLEALGRLAGGPSAAPA